MSVSKNDLSERFQRFLRAPDFSCVGAKSALARDQMEIIRARDMTSGWDDLRIYPALFELAQRYRAEPNLFQSLVVLFEEPRTLSEAEFEGHMWQRLQSLADKDAWRGVPHDPEVDSDPESPHFSFSVGGEAFFIVGLHPNASRPARRFEAPAIVFNIRRQFEMLREQGKYERLRESILERDLALAGTPNPMIARHGEASAARQYSGRAVANDWQCPFHPPSRNLADAS
ncbi:guanitoxin biosynthesis heme-dependent pre-guanitoxin N-hydroxylase GntA [Terrihabitans sp. B22-R8]|uniref:guanitoxin biosynthesis heme-dependent pre-guanitoxin N-hydroxylase GntA n=1 Tax=Terrihabitans sp. B22-R8 TaxID=3425128 RepID=UPI00403CD523